MLSMDHTWLHGVVRAWLCDGGFGTGIVGRQTIMLVRFCCRMPSCICGVPSHLLRPCLGDLGWSADFGWMTPPLAASQRCCRAIAGNWSYGAGIIEIPNQARLAGRAAKNCRSARCAQRLPIRRRRSPLWGATFATIWTCVRLSHLQDKLDEADNWSIRLSPGEQQRLAFVRVLLTGPEVVFLDEAGSALNGEAEQALYNPLLQELPQAAIISIARREVVACYRQLHWKSVAQERAPVPADSATWSARIYHIHQSALPCKGDEPAVLWLLRGLQAGYLATRHASIVFCFSAAANGRNWRLRDTP